MDPNERSILSPESLTSGVGPMRNSTLNPTATEFRPVEPNPPGFQPPGVHNQDRQRTFHPSIDPVIHPHQMVASNAGPYVTNVPNFPVQYPTMPVQLPVLNPPPFFERNQYGMLSYPKLQPPPQQYPLPIATNQTQIENTRTTLLQQNTLPISTNQMQIEESRQTPVIKPSRRTKRAMGWPEGHPPIPDLNFYGVHPSKIPDSVFLGEQDNAFLEVKDPFESGSFDASRTPWWTHWLIAVAHACTAVPQPDIWKLYKWRYRDVIPNVHRLTIINEMELFKHVEENEDRYAYEWEERDEPSLRLLVYEYRDEVHYKAEYIKAEKKKKNSNSK